MHQRSHFIRFLGVGGVNFLLIFLVFFFLLNIFLLPYPVALGVTWLFGNCLTYTLNSIWVFGLSVAVSGFLFSYSLAGLVSLIANLGRSC